ncbi:uncharacterized protein M6B38_375970 [Iris pallida]|uniref:Uncharacterized protein n=1 Tax=Iris pallida TaxID=29817 RepID=A0AAX6GA99_IRIPA|nr:uncharacterized protein M6B38_375970 [Iris pallida]
MEAKNPPKKQEEPAPEPEEKPVPFDPSRMIGIIKRKALIKDLADAYRAECLACCQELLQHQRKWEEQLYSERRIPEDPRKQSMMKPSKRPKKGL